MRSPAGSWAPLALVFILSLGWSRSAAAFCLPGIVRVTLMPLVADGGSCEGSNPEDGPLLCRMLPQDLYACCGVGSSIVECLSSDCCPDSYPVVDAVPDMVVDEVMDEVTGGDSAEPNIAECRVSESQGCELGFLRSNLGERDSWMVYPEGGQPCLDGSEYSFQVFPGEPNGRLLLWFQGGGACDSYESCFRPDLVTATPSVVPNAGGLFDVRRGEANPAVAGGWTMVVVNYCSADVHVGNTVHNFSSASGETTRAAAYAGVNHTRAVLSWIDEQDFGGGETRRVAGGCSAGSIGVQLWAPALIADFDFSDGILMDSYVGIMPPAADVFWNLINVCEVGEQQLMWSREAVEACREGFYVPSFTTALLRDNSEVPAMYVGTNNDIIQRGFYVATAGDLLDTEKQVFVEAAKYINVNLPPLLQGVMANHSAASPAFQSVVVQGEEHCLVSASELYTMGGGGGEEGESLLQQVTAFLNAEDQQESSTPQPTFQGGISNVDEDSHAAVTAFSAAMHAALIVAALSCLLATLM